LYLASSGLEQALKHADTTKTVTKTRKKKEQDKVTDRIIVQKASEEKDDAIEVLKPEKKKKTKKKVKKAEKAEKETAGSHGHENGTAGATPSHTEDSPLQKTRRKSVRFSLKKNLVRRIGEPPFPENVRTPPTSKPKGSALKQKTLASENRKRMLSFSNATNEPSSLETKKKKTKKDTKKKKKKKTKTES